MKYALILTLLASQFALASGWNCTERNKGPHHAKLTNHTDKPRVPAVFIVSDKSGTLVSAKNDGIKKKIVANGVIYSGYGEDNYSASLFVQYREGVEAPLENGDVVFGNLTVTVEGESQSYKMDCARYLKND